MDWYFKETTSDLFVPSDLETAEPCFIHDRSPMPNDWFRWGINACESFGFQTEISYGKLNAKDGLIMKVGHESPVYRSEGSSNQDACGTFSPVETTNSQVPSIQQALLIDRPDYQLYNSTERTDAIFFASFLQEGPSKTRKMIHPHRSIKDDPSIESIQYQRQWGLLGEDRENVNVRPSSYLMQDGLDRTEGLQMDRMFSRLIANEQSVVSETVQEGPEEMCQEEIVLQELKDVIAKLTLNVRICARDALYRLAQTTKHPHSANRNELVNSLIDECCAAVAGGGTLRYHGS